MITNLYLYTDSQIWSLIRWIEYENPAPASPSKMRLQALYRELVLRTVELYRKPATVD